ncbi:MAG: cupin domain-containing protein [Proteobacteria bacterium]|nr:cupin domain-containing protein [Pseudomonadota bacterium]
MVKTSFGEMDILLRNAHGPRVELLKFKSEGRAHSHKDYESFFVMSGKGQVYVGDNIIKVEPGSLVVIPPDTKHWMKPEANSLLEGLLWYHSEKLEINLI